MCFISNRLFLGLVTIGHTGYDSSYRSTQEQWYSMADNRWLCSFRFIIAALISYEISFNYQWDNHFWSVISTLLTLQSIPHDRVPFIHAVLLASDRTVSSILGCMVGLATYIFLATIILEDYFFWLVDITIVLNIALSMYLYTASPRLRMAVVSSTLVLTMSFLSDDISSIVLIYAYEIMIGVIVACIVYLVTLPLFFWNAKIQQKAVRHAARLSFLTASKGLE